MSRPVTIFSAQWTDLPFEQFCEKVKSFGYDGIEIACWGDHLDVKKAATDSNSAMTVREVHLTFCHQWLSLGQATHHGLCLAELGQR